MFDIKTDDPEIRRLFDSLTPGAREQLFCEQWFANPDGQFRRHIVEMLVQAGSARWTDGGVAFNTGNPAVRIVAGLMEIVGRWLDEPADENRTMEDYARQRSIQ